MHAKRILKTDRVYISDYSAARLNHHAVNKSVAIPSGTSFLTNVRKNKRAALNADIDDARFNTIDVSLPDIVKKSNNKPPSMTTGKKDKSE